LRDKAGTTLEAISATVVVDGEAHRSSGTMRLTIWDCLAAARYTMIITEEHRSASPQFSGAEKQKARSIERAS